MPTITAELLRGIAIGAAAAACVLSALHKRRQRKKGGTYHAGMIKAKPGMIEQYMQVHIAPRIQHANADTVLTPVSCRFLH